MQPLNLQESYELQRLAIMMLSFPWFPWRSSASTHMDLVSSSTRFCQMVTMTW